MRRSGAVLIGLMLGCAPVAAAGTDGPFLVVETGSRHMELADAMRAAGEGATIRIAAGRYRQCAVQEKGSLRLEAETPGQVVFDSTLCEGQAALVLRGERTEIDGIVFENMRKADQSAAAIRIERGALTVRNAMFRDSDRGISAGADPAETIRVDRSTFANLGGCGATPRCGSAIEASYYGAVIVTRSMFENGQGGHHVMSRAMRIEVSGSRFDDSAGQGAGRMIDLPAGATGEIRSNSFVLGPGKQKMEAFIAVASASRQNMSDGLFITDNKAGFAPEVMRVASFVSDASGERVTVAGNELATGILTRELR